MKNDQFLLGHSFCQPLLLEGFRRASLKEFKKKMNEFIIYKAENLENGFVYIGSTSRCLDERKKDHIQKANIGTGHQFQEAIGTYGSDSFTWEQIDTANTTNELANKEKDYILEYNSKDNGYNQDSGGGFKKLVYQYDLNGELQNTFECLQDAAEAVGVNKKSISAACLGKIKSCKNYFWSYDLLDAYGPIIDNRLKQVKQFDFNWVLMNTYPSIAVASNSTTVNKSCIAKCCRGERKSAGG
ncbi:NUMOD1 domain-containing DNA-binding protein, partial [Winogradskyella sediminis]|uniref:NUMOD1 domain-containing DNA-binding protein n=1 Tax=Winogradskyella sediminis TaxID=1382466 RepID=UPI003AA9AA93